MISHKQHEYHVKVAVTVGVTVTAVLAVVAIFAQDGRAAGIAGTLAGLLTNFAWIWE